MRRLFRQFSFPGGIPSHVAPETPGSIHEGGELGYALVARLRRGVRQPRPGRVLRRRRRRGRDRAAGHQLALEQVPRPGGDGAVLPILHLNGYKIANPTVLARIPRRRADRAAARATATRRTSSTGDDPADGPPAAGRDARRGHRRDRRDPAARPRGRRHRAAALADDRAAHAEGLDRPKEVDGQPVEGTWRSHQVPLAEVRTNAGAPGACSRSGCASYRPEELFDDDGRAGRRARRAAAGGDAPDERQPARQRRRAAARPRPARLPRLRRRRRHARRHDRPRRRGSSGTWLRDVMARQPGPTSGCSAPTRRPRTGSARCSR